MTNSWKTYRFSSSAHHQANQSTGLFGIVLKISTRSSTSKALTLTWCSVLSCSEATLGLLWRSLRNRLNCPDGNMWVWRYNDTNETTWDVIDVPLVTYGQYQNLRSSIKKDGLPLSVLAQLGMHVDVREDQPQKIRSSLIHKTPALASRIFRQ